jgi:peptidoglycan/xylan/chitin deacetylase (PgdA/CDA1 family)
MRSAILMYHSVTSDEPVDPYGVSRRAFCDQLAWLIDKEYQFVSLAALVQSVRIGSIAKRRKRVVLTFDDGYRDFYVNALPILLRHRLPATVFLVTDLLGQSSTWSSRRQDIPLMTEAEVRQVKAQGIDLGSHTLTHVDLTTLGENELRRQLVMSRRALSHFGETFFAFSYPWGKYSDREAEAVRAAGYECAVTVGATKGVRSVDSYRLGRHIVHRELDIGSFGRMFSASVWSQQIPARARRFVRGVQGRTLSGKRNS